MCYIFMSNLALYNKNVHADAITFSFLHMTILFLNICRYGAEVSHSAASVILSGIVSPATVFTDN